MGRWKLRTHRHPRSNFGLSGTLIIGTLIVLARPAVMAQDLPTDAQMQAAFGQSYDRLGLMEYCAAKGFASPTDVGNARKMVAAITNGITVGAAAKAQEAVGRRGMIVGKQATGLLDASNTARPEVVSVGRMMSLADDARAQRTTERVLCAQTAAQVAPFP